MYQLDSIDYIIIFVYFTTTLFVGLWFVAKRNQSPTEFAIADKTMSS